MLTVLRSIPHKVNIVLLVLAIQVLSYSAFAAESLIDINTAPVSLLAEKLPGIGPAKAKAIVVYREKNGPFKTLDSLIDVKGIGVLTLDKIRGYLSIQQPNAVEHKGGFNKTSKAPALGEHEKSELKVVRAVRAAVNVARRYQARVPD